MSEMAYHKIRQFLCDYNTKGVKSDIDDDDDCNVATLGQTQTQDIPGHPGPG